MPFVLPHSSQSVGFFLWKSARCSITKSTKSTDHSPGNSFIPFSTNWNLGLVPYFCWCQLEAGWTCEPAKTRQRFPTLIWSKSHVLASLHTSSLSSMTAMCVINTSAPDFIRLHWHSNKSSDSKTLNWTTPVYILTKSGQILWGAVVGTVVSQHRGGRMWFQILYFSPICVVHLSYFAVLLNYNLGWGVRRLIVVYYSCK